VASPLEVQVLLCDAAVADPSGKMHMLGAGWSMTSSPTAPCAVAVMVKVPWDRTNQQIPLTVTLVDSDGRPVELPAPGDQTQNIKAEGIVEVGRPAGIPAGSSVDAAFALNVPSLPLSPGRYEYRVDVSDQTFHAGFLVR
jgi:hypothetical protein